MTDKEVLQKAIEIAMDNKYWESVDKPKVLVMDSYNDTIRKVLITGTPSMELDYQLIIFSHDFAKAFWGDMKISDFIRIKTRRGLTVPFNAELMKADYLWQYHLQQMVLCSNPIDYLRKFVDNTESKEKLRAKDAILRNEEKEGGHL